MTGILSEKLNKLKSSFIPFKMAPAQQWLDENYPRKEERKKVSKLEIKNKSLKDQLDLRDFINLKKLDCSSNKITSLNVNGLTKLEDLKCSGNEISELDLSENIELKTLYCKDQKK